MYSSHKANSMLKELLHANTISLAQLSAYSGFTLDDLSYVLRGGEVYETDAKRVIQALSRITGKTYALEQVDINWVPEEP